MAEVHVSVQPTDIVLAGRNRAARGGFHEQAILSVSEGGLIVGKRNDAFYANGMILDNGTKVELCRLPNGSYDIASALHAFRIIDALAPGLSWRPFEYIVDLSAVDTNEQRRNTLINDVVVEWASGMAHSEFLRGLLRFGARQFINGVLSSGYDPIRLNELCTTLDDRGIAYDRRRIDELNELNLQHALVMHAAVNGYPAPFTRNTSI